MTREELDNTVTALNNVADTLSSAAAQIKFLRDGEQHADPAYAAAFSLIIRSIEDAAVTTSAMARVSLSHNNYADLEPQLGSA